MVSLFKGYGAGYKGLIPPYIVLTAAPGAVLRGRLPGRALQAVRHRRRSGAEPLRGRRRRGPGHHRPAAEGSPRAAAQAQHAGARRCHGDPQLAALDDCEKQAYDLILGDAGKVFDLAQEKDDLRDRYGRNTFGQSCLVARRLVESGVPYITINYRAGTRTSSTSKPCAGSCRSWTRAWPRCWRILSDRGLLESTIVWCCGEFGRTPKVHWEPPWNGGRGHYGKVFSALVAGGGFKGGHVVGSSDAKGEEVKDRPVYPVDLSAACTSCWASTPTAKLPHPQGPAATVLPTAGEKAADGRTIERNHVKPAPALVGRRPPTPMQERFMISLRWFAAFGLALFLAAPRPHAQRRRPARRLRLSRPAGARHDVRSRHRRAIPGRRR